MDEMFANNVPRDEYTYCAAMNVSYHGLPPLETNTPSRTAVHPIPSDAILTLVCPSSVHALFYPRCVPLFVTPTFYYLILVYRLSLFGFVDYILHPDVASAHLRAPLSPSYLSVIHPSPKRRAQSGVYVARGRGIPAENELTPVSSLRTLPNTTHLIYPPPQNINMCAQVEGIWQREAEIALPIPNLLSTYALGLPVCPCVFYLPRLLSIFCQRAEKACKEAGKWREAAEFLQRMRADGVPPNTIAYNTVIGACAFFGKPNKAWNNNRVSSSFVRPTSAVRFRK